MLALIDNPMQDIPLAGVLKSPIGGMKDRELAIVMAEFKKNPDRGEDVGFYGAVKRYLEKHGESEEDAVIYRKLAAFQNLLTTLREESMYLPVSRLIYRIFDLTGYDKYAAAMPAGKTRQANLAMLVQKAEDYEKTSYQGLFDFIRYIEKLKKYNTDFGEASRSGEHDDAVRIMSIHKSKGLEFPVVFLAGCGKKFNRQDARGRILIDEELGIAADFFDPEKKVKAPTLKKNVLARRSNLENMGEELRILYVAMTRAKEKLIITAGIIVLAIIVAIVVFVLVLNDAERRIPVQYSKKMQGRRMIGGQSTYIPLKVNTANVIPVIFASSIMSMPVMIAQFFHVDYSTIGGKILLALSSSNWFKPEAPAYSIGMLVYIVLVVLFAYFYTSITFNPLEVANNMKKSGGFIPGIRPGKPTSDYLNNILNYIVFIGACGLVIVCIIPIIASGLFSVGNLSFGGTSLIIIAGVILETIKAVESMMLVRNYKGFLND